MRRVGVILGLCALSVACAPTTASGASWSAPVNVSSPTQSVENPLIGFDNTGVGFAAWRWFQGIGPAAHSGVRIGSQTGPGSFTLEQTVLAPLSVPEIYGRDQVFWRGEEGIVRRRQQLTRIKVAFGRTNGHVGKPRTVATDRIFRIPAADVNHSGQIALAYVRTTRVHNREAILFVGHGRRLGRSRIVSRRSGVNAVTVAVGPRGDIVVAWERDGKIEARIRRPGHRLGNVLSVGKGARLQTRLRAAVAASGRVWIAWESKRIGGVGTDVELQTAVSSARRSIFGRPRVLDRYDRRNEPSDEVSVDLSLDPHGRGMVAWSSFDGQNLRARLAAFDRTARSVRLTTLSQPGYDAAVADLATSRRSNEALVVWTRLDAVGELGTTVLAGHLPEVGAYGGEEQVSTGDRARKPAVAFNFESGLPTTVWSQREGPDGAGVPPAQVRTFVRASTRTP
jgi:hypothetical protein